MQISKMNALKTGLLSLTALSFASTSFAQISERTAPRRLAVKAAAPCVNPDAPCPGAPILINLRKLSKMEKRDQKAYVEKRIQQNFPEAEPAMLEGGSGLIIALLAAAELRDVEGEPIARLSGGPCCSFEVGVKIKFGKK